MRWSRLRLVVAAVCLGSTAVSRADVLVNFQDAIQPTKPAPGWAFLWNQSGTIFNSSNLAPLVYIPTLASGSVVYNEDGMLPMPRPLPAWDVLISNNDGKYGGGHPGRGIDDFGSGGIERFAIAAYTLSNGGTVNMTNVVLANTDTSFDGLDLMILIRNSNSSQLQTVFQGVTAAGLGSSLAFSTRLGWYNAGDTIYVAVGARSHDAFDSYALSFSIAQAVPEPGPMVLTLFGALTFAAYFRIKVFRG